MNLKFSLIVLTVIISFSSCVNYKKTMREPNARVEFEKEDFIFSDEVSGDAREVIVLGIDWHRFLKKSDGDVQPTRVNIPIIGTNIYNSRAAGYAMFNMMSDHPGYDVIFYPKYTAKVSRPILGIGFLWRKTDMKVSARLGKITLTEGHTDMDE